MTDDDYMALAMRQADGAIQRGEQPFGAVIVDADGNPVSMAGQQVKTHPAYHAEIVALAAAGGPGKLQRHTLYSTVEPCPMCSFMARQCQVSRVVFGLWSPLMGGYTHWPILQDTKLNKSELGIA